MKNHHRHHQYERHYQRHGGIGPAMMCEMIKRNDLLRLSETVIKPFYYQRVQETIAIIRRYLPEDRCLIHKPEGAIFLWLWFKDLPITTEQLLSAPESTRRADGAGAQLLPRAGQTVAAYASMYAHELRTRAGEN